MPMTRTILSVLILFIPLAAQAEQHPACRKQLIRYCISMYASWDMPPTLANCVAAMEPAPGVTPAWYALRGELAGGTIPPLARYQQCVEATRRPRP